MIEHVSSVFIWIGISPHHVINNPCEGYELILGNENLLLSLKGCVDLQCPEADAMAKCQSNANGCTHFC
jgi:hypothetical protein